MSVYSIPPRHIDRELLEIDSVWYHRMGGFIFKMDHSDVNRNMSVGYVGATGVCRVKHARKLNKENVYIGKVHNE